MELSPRRRATLGAIVDAFAPGDGVAIPAGSDLRSDDLAADFVARSPRDADGNSLSHALGLLDNRLFCTAVLGTRGQRFLDLSTVDRERALIDLARSRFPQKRMLFKRLRNVALLSYYASGDAARAAPGGEDGRGADLMAAIGYPQQSPPKKLRGRAMRSLRPLMPTRYEIDASTACDVVVIGSGAGGAVAAAELAAAGLDVLVLERGEYPSGIDSDGTELDALGSLFASSPFWTEDGQSYLLSARCLGGGTAYSFGGFYDLPEQVRSGWAKVGIELGSEFDKAMEAVRARAGVGNGHADLSARDQLLEQGCQALDLPIREVPLAAHVQDAAEAGRWGPACRLGADQDAGRTWLRDAQKNGARIVAGAQARTIEVEANRARTVIARTSGGSWLTVRCSAVVVAAGAYETPALLARSGIGGQHVGKHLHLQPTASVLGVFGQQVDPWEGTPTSLYSDALADLDGAGYGVRLETAPLTPALASSYVPWRNAAEHLNVMRQLPHLSGVRAMVRDMGAGEVVMDRSGEPSVRYELSDADRRHLRTGVDTAVKVLEAAGARRIFTGQQRGGDYVPGEQRLEKFLSESHQAGYGIGEIALSSFSPTSSARMASSPRHGVTDPDGALFDVPNVVIADASMLPTATGVHPSAIVGALAAQHARALAHRLAHR